MTRKRKVRFETAVQAGESIQETAEETTEAIAEPINQGLDMLGEAQETVNQPVSNVVNGITRMINSAASVLGDQELLEKDPTGPIEVLSESFTIIGDMIRAIDANAHDFLGLDSRVPKALIKLGEKGDEVCDNSKGDIRMTIEYPGFARQFNACIDMKTARNLAKQLGNVPVKPIENFANCALSEVIMKPIDHNIRDIKNNIADIVTAVKKPEDVVGNIRTAATDISEVLHKGVAGSYLLFDPYDYGDALTCFQAKTNGVPFETVGFSELGEGIVSMKFIGGQKIEPTPFSKKLERCNDHDTCPI